MPGEDRDTKEKLCEDGVRDCRVVATSPGHLGEPYPRALPGARPCPRPNSGCNFQDCERKPCCCLKPPSPPWREEGRHDRGGRSGLVGQEEDLQACV